MAPPTRHQSFVLFYGLFSPSFLKLYTFCTSVVDQEGPESPLGRNADEAFFSRLLPGPAAPRQLSVLAADATDHRRCRVESVTISWSRFNRPKPSVRLTKVRPRPGPQQNAAIHREGEPGEPVKLFMGPRPDGAQSGSHWLEEIRANQSFWTGPCGNGSELTAPVELV